MPDPNQPVIEEFRAGGGAAGGPFAGVPLVLLTTAGARTGRPHTTPAVYLRDGERILVFASNAGRPAHPAWFHNLLADPHVTVEIGEAGAVRSYSTRAQPLEGAERDRWYEEQSRRFPRFRDYQAGTSRTIPVVALHPFVLTADPARNRAIGEQLVRHHDELRAALAALRSGFDAPAPTVRHELFGHCLTFCDTLRLHHLREDGSFTAFEHLPGLGPAIERLREEHQVVAKILAELRAALERPGEIDTLRAELAELTPRLEEHFAYEERQLLPALNSAASA